MIDLVQCAKMWLLEFVAFEEFYPSCSLHVHFSIQGVVFFVCNRDFLIQFRIKLNFYINIDRQMRRKKERR